MGEVEVILCCHIVMLMQVLSVHIEDIIINISYFIDSAQNLS